MTGYGWEANQHYQKPYGPPRPPPPPEVDWKGQRVKDFGKVDLFGTYNPHGAIQDDPGHCDDVADNPETPAFVRDFINYERLPCVDQWEEQKKPGFVAPELYGTTPLGFRVRVVLCSRFGHVGVSRIINRSMGYEKYCRLPQLSNLSPTPEVQ